MLRVAIVGCGKIADQHVSAIKLIRNARIVGVCDREELMAEQLAERYSIGYFSADPGQLLEKVKPDVVHITTPPRSHLPLAVQCIEAGCHIYVEKPFTLDTIEASKLINLAEDQGLKLTAGHNLQYTLENMEARRLVRAGFLGGPPVHLESYYTYNLKDAGYAKALLGDRDHWVRHLPGGLLHNLISHGIARIAEFMDAENPVVSAFGYTSPLLQAIGESEIFDELRVHIFDKRNTTASFLFSTQLSPPLNEFRIYGPKNSIVVDNLHRTINRFKNKGYKSYLNYFIPPLESAANHVRNSGSNIYRFLRMQFHDDSGMKNLIEAFYKSIADKGTLPISHREIILTSRIMDSVFQQLRTQRGAVECATA